MAGDIIVEREVTVHRGRATSKLSMHVRRPTREPTGEYRCAFEVRAGTKLLWKCPGTFGVDSVQALLHALMLAAVHIESVAKSMKGRIEPWELRDLRRLRGKAPRRRSAQVKRAASAPIKQRTGSRQR